MTVVRTLGKNTLGDNNKMKIAMREYDMSTHDISTIFRSSLGVGTLVPFVKILCQKGDIISGQLVNKTLTQPTLGPLFGAYKLQHFMFFAGFRLYNSWLHNNRTGIGMDMSNIKLPMMCSQALPQSDAMPNTNKVKRFKHNSASLYNYLGWKGTSNYTTGNKTAYKNGVPLLMYQDIFKNYFANTQEDNFYVIGRGVQLANLKFAINSDTANYFPEQKSLSSADNISLVTVKTDGTNGIFQKLPENVTWDEIWETISIQNVTNKKVCTVKQCANSANGPKVTLGNLAEKVGTGLCEIFISDPNRLQGFLKTIAVVIEKHKLSVLDDLRDLILGTKGNTTLLLEKTNTNLTNKIPSATYRELADYITNIIYSQDSKLGGLLLKTYDSDIFNNWVKKEWVEGTGSIAERTAIDVSDGKLSMDTLNLQQKVYNMLNRIAVSGGTYRDWLETVYTAGKYMDRPETPVFIGGMTQIIDFDEIHSTAATDGQPLGDLASIGRAGRPMNSGHIHYQCEEPGYIMGIVAITPLVDYSQGNDFDLNLQTMDDMHKPALDGIGYQDLIAEQAAWWAVGEGGEMPNEIKHKSIGKTVAWIDYMTNFNRTYGDFAAGEALDFMVLNRRYEGDIWKGEIDDITTYIDPTKHVEIFADTDITSQNFWIQTAFNATRRGNYSAKQIPFL